MPKFEITPDFDETLQLEFSIPRKSGAPIEFTVPKFEYSPPEMGDKLDEWIQEQKKKGVEPQGRIFILKMLELSTSPAIYRKLEKLTMGELNQIWKFWQEGSKVDLGESSASDAS